MIPEDLLLEKTAFEDASFEGEGVELITLISSTSAVQLTNFGASLVAWLVQDGHGKWRDVLLGCPTASGYLGDQPCFGAMVGRYANRIARGELVIDGVTHQLDVNNNGNTLHGGSKGWNRRCWTVVARPTPGSVTLGIADEAGTMGFPGEVRAEVTYTLDGDELEFAVRATTDAKTVVNVTNHAYFNLGDTDTILDHALQTVCDKITAVDKDGIPTGDTPAVANTAFDFRGPRLLGEGLTVGEIGERGGLDHNFLIPDWTGEIMVNAATVTAPSTGLTLDLLTTQPGVQIYTTNGAPSPGTGKGGASYLVHGGICLEPQHPPDAPHHPGFPDTVLTPGEMYATRSVYRIGRS